MVPASSATAARSRVRDGDPAAQHARAVGPALAAEAPAAARERIAAHGGRFSRERRSDGACVLRSRIPVAHARPRGGG